MSDVASSLNSNRCAVWVAGSTLIHTAHKMSYCDVQDRDDTPEFPPESPKRCGAQTSTTKQFWLSSVRLVAFILRVWFSPPVYI